MPEIQALNESDTFGKWFEKINEIISNYNDTDSLSSIINEIMTQAQNAGQIGDYIKNGQASDYNLYTKNGIYHLNSTGTTNYPEENIAFNLYVAATQENLITQLAISIENKSPKLYFRSKLSNNSNWTSWIKLLSDEEAKNLYLPFTGGEIDNLTVSNDLNVNGEISSKGNISTEEKFIIQNSTKDITLSCSSTDFSISLPSGNEGEEQEIKPLVIDFETNKANINGLAEKANKLTKNGLTQVYTESNENLAASGKAIFDLYTFCMETFSKNSGDIFKGIVEFKENIILNKVIYSPTDISFRPTDKLQIVSNSNFSELYLDKDNEPVIEHPHVIGTRRRTGITNYNIGSLVFDTSCIEISEENFNLRLRKTNSTTLENSLENVAFNFNRTEIKPTVDNTISLGSPSFKFSQIYASSDAINTSDRNLKQDITNIDETLIENWGNVQWCSFKFKASVEEKGEDARIHTGLIAQDLYNTLEDYSIDASKYGFFCHDTWDDQYDIQYVTAIEEDEEGNPKEIQKEVKTLIKEAGEQYSLRYMEIQAIENVYLRKEIEKLKTEIEALKASISELQPQT